MNPILCGIETEYGLWIEGRGPGEQIEDATEVVRSYPNPCYVGWDYRFESPRADMRGFSVEHLAVDPEDLKYDACKQLPPAHILRADRVLPDGSRFYNDHGHPEIATRECFSVDEAAQCDLDGEQVVLAAVQAYAARTGLNVKAYKNNTDFHGASYGTHESYLVPRSLEFAELFHAVTPMLVARQILTGAGKVGREHGSPCDFQLSQRADFFSEAANVETLFRRPVFNTRDEPHAEPEAWRRLHVISGDANRMQSCTRRKMFLIRLAIQLALIGEAPKWRLADPVRAFESVSKDAKFDFRVELDGNWTTAYEIIESYLSAAERFDLVSSEERPLLDKSRHLLSLLKSDYDTFSRHVDWAAKRNLVEMYREEEGLSWGDASLQAVDLAYADIDPAESLYQALVDSDQVEAASFSPPQFLSRGVVRAAAVSNWSSYLRQVSWRALTFEIDGQLKPVELRPDIAYPATLWEARNVNEFISLLEGVLSP